MDLPTDLIQKPQPYSHGILRYTSDPISLRNSRISGNDLSYMYFRRYPYITCSSVFMRRTRPDILIKCSLISDGTFAARHKRTMVSVVGILWPLMMRLILFSVIPVLLDSSARVIFFQLRILSQQSGMSLDNDLKTCAVSKIFALTGLTKRFKKQKSFPRVFLIFRERTYSISHVRVFVENKNGACHLLSR